MHIEYRRENKLSKTFFNVFCWYFSLQTCNSRYHYNYSTSAFAEIVMIEVIITSQYYITVELLKYITDSF